MARVEHPFRLFFVFVFLFARGLQGFAAFMGDLVISEVRTHSNVAVRADRRDSISGVFAVAVWTRFLGWAGVLALRQACVSSLFVA